MNARNDWTSLIRAIASIVIALSLVPRAARADVEARCLPGWDVLPTPPSRTADRIVVACGHGALQIVANIIEHGIPPGDARETALTDQLASRLSDTGAGSATPFRAETIGALHARVSDVAGSESAANGTTDRVAGQLVLVPVGASTVVVMGISRDAAHSDARPALRAFLPTIVGLEGNTPPWRATATCPSGTTEAPTQGATSDGRRRVVRCSGANMQLEASESHLPMRGVDDARAPAAAVQQSLQTQFAQIGGTVTMDPLRPVGTGAAQGFLTSVHGSAADPRAPAGTSAPMIHIDLVVAMVPTSVGNVEIEAVSRAGDGAPLEQLVRGFIEHQLRLDATIVATTEPTAPVGDGGVDEAPAAHAQPRPQREIDPNEPAWEPPPADRPRATEPPARKSCGCSVPGDAHAPLHAAAASVLAIAMASRRRRDRAKST